jgi:hypothetical protein
MSNKRKDHRRTEIKWAKKPKRNIPYQRQDRYKMKFGIRNYQPDDWRDW